MGAEGPLFHKPSSIVAAGKILYSIIFLFLIGSVIGEFTTNQHNFSSVWGISATLANLLFLLFVTHQIRLGKIWARTLLLVVFILAIVPLPIVIRLRLDHGLVLLFILAFRVILEIAVIIFLFQRSSTAWFKEVALLSDKK